MQTSSSTMSVSDKADVFRKSHSSQPPAHCLDTLRQQLMCVVDVAVLGQVWYQPPGKALQAFVDFNTVHTCRNFDAIREWAEKHQLPNQGDTPSDFLALPKAGDRIYHAVP